jgi:2-polyprenyl-3-methyl-5-hydroxy-6-metoxy-1,4-benzoquinol methylase
MMACDEVACGLHWLSSILAKEDMHIAYDSYYTHGESSRSLSLPERVSEWIFQRMDRLNESLLGLRKERMRFGSAYLDSMPPGRLLDVGCGSGEFLRKMQARGWYAEGTDFDPRVAAALASSGIMVRIGELADIEYPDHSFDAVTLRHVIEHVTSPVTLLAECWRLLKPGGVLVISTPNIQSMGHRIYKRHWRGLEPPRHLQLFSVLSLGNAASRAGLDSYTLFTTAQGASYFFRESEKLSSPYWVWRIDRLLIWFWIWQCSEFVQSRKRNEHVAEELVMVVKKP